MRILFYSLVLALTAGPAMAASQDLRFYHVDLFPPTQAMAADPNGSLAKRLPELPALASMYQFGPSTGILTVEADPTNHAKIERLVAAFNARPRIAVQYTVMNNGHGVYNGVALVRHNDDYMPGASSTNVIGNTVASGYIVRANASVRDGRVATRLVVWAKPAGGGANELDRTVVLQPGMEAEVPLEGPDKLSLKVTAQVLPLR